MPAAATAKVRKLKRPEGKSASGHAAHGLDYSSIYSMLESMPLNVMLADHTGAIVYINQKSRETFKKLEKYLPVSSDRVMGSSFDIFHRNPAMQKKMVADERNLPHKAIIQLGEEKLELVINAARDAQGEYIGPMVTWEIVTERVKLEEQNFDSRSHLMAISRSMAYIEFSLDGTVVDANENFLKTMGYSLDEVRGKHHRVFVDPAYANSPEYRAFWDRLNRGEFDAGEYRRIGKGGKELYIQASYNPMLDKNGKPYRIVKYAVDVSRQKLKDQELAALSKTQAVIEFNLDGTIVGANDNFLNALGYRLQDVVGKHHSMFCEEAFVNSNRYREFWAKLNRGEFDQGQYKRIAKGGRVVWIQAAYNPVFDLNGKIFKVVKYASDITKQKEQQIELMRALADTANQLGAAAEELSAISSQMSKNAQQTAERSNSAAANSEEVAKGVQTVATNTEEMVASIKEIARSSSDAAGISKDAMGKAVETNTTITQLGEASQEIGNVIKVISSIAQQTNLLALNATIEAARAGDAGKGFAVVANEVKELAKQTAKATEDITNRIGAIQESSKGAVTAIGGISKTIEQINSITMTIAAAVEEQTATTNEVSRVVQESNQAVEDIAGLVKSVAGAATESAAGANQTLESAHGLAKLATTLKDLIKKMDSAEA